MYFVCFRVNSPLLQCILVQDEQLTVSIVSENTETKMWGKTLHSTE